MSRQTDTHQEEQEKLLEEAMNVVKQNSFQMKRCLDSGKLMDALKHCSTMLSELRTGLLSPKYYYELYMGVFDQLRFLEAYLVEEHKKGKKISDLYELVQYAGNIVPRLYLLITVGAVYIETNEAPTREILIDMVEMCRGVQHPTRGLFLRNYLSQMTKNKLPDNSTVVGVMNKNYSGLTLVASQNPDGESGNLLDSIYFVMTNFTEMTKLWVRMQHQGHSKDRERREQERKELKILVGTNLVRLSELEGVDLDIYKTKILPNILEQVVSCKDVIAQDYLMEIIIQVFQDEFHLRTLQSYLEACAKLVKGVNVKGIISSLIDRLARYASSEGGGIPGDIPLFEIFSKQIQEIFDSRPDMLIQDIISLQLSLLNLSISCYPNRLDYVDQVLKVTYEKIKACSESKGIDKQNSAAGKQLIKLLTIPIDNYNNVLTLLKLENYAPIFSFLSYSARKSICIALVENILKNDTVIDDADDASKLLDLIGPLVRDEEDKEEQSDDDFAEEQTLVARMVNLFKNESCDRQYQILTVIRKYFGAGGDRIKFTLPPLVFASLSLALKYRQIQEEDELWSKKAQKVFQFSHQTTSALSKSGSFETALRLFLQCAQAADICMFETIAYEFITQAFLTYEESISDSKAQLAAITLIIGTLQTTRCFNAENRDTLNTKCALYSTKLLRKPDQCYSVQLCSHLFWAIAIPGRDKFLPQGTELYTEGKRALECLQKSLKIADSCMESGANVQLFVQILNRYLYYYEKGNESVTLKYINGLIDLIVTNSSGLPPTDESTKNTKTHFANTTQYIKFRKTNPLQGSLPMGEVETPSI